jgi:hypothetical protein
VLTWAIEQNATYVSAFETTIRSLGGLLGAYDLSGDNRLLQLAVDLADRLLAAYDTPSGLPPYGIDLSG